MSAVAVAVPSERAGRRVRTILLLCALLVGALAAVAPYLSPYDRPVSSYHVKTVGTTAAHVAIGMSFLLVGLLAWARRPENRVGPLMTAAGFAFYTTDLGWLHLPWTTVFADEWRGIFYAVLFQLLLAFPTGRLSTRADRIFVESFYLWAAVVRPFPSAAFFDPHVEGPVGLPRNPLLVRADPGLNDTIDQWLARVDLLFIGTLFVLVFLHWRRSGRHARRALTPVFFVAAFVVVPLLAGVAVGGTTQDWLLEWSAQILLALLPVGFLAGLLRMRLARSAVADLVLELQDAHDPRRIRDALSRALDDPSLEVGYWLPASGAFVDAGGGPVDLTARAATVVESDGGPVAALVYDESLQDEPDLVEAVAATARLTLENERLHAELRAQLDEVRASRARIVAAGDAERRRLERDLHDGAQQRLLALGLALQMARAAPGEAESLLAEAENELQEALAELRDLARGIHPAILTGGGLGPALTTLAERAPIPVTVEACDARLPPVVETAAYFVVSEALANVAKHAHATRACVTVGVRDGQASVVVEDDGVGGVDPAAGSGLVGLTDRVQALDGSLTIETPPGGGTRVRAQLPCA